MRERGSREMETERWKQRDGSREIETKKLQFVLVREPFYNTVYMLTHIVLMPFNSSFIPSSSYSFSLFLPSSFFPSSFFPSSFFPSYFFQVRDAKRGKEKHFDELIAFKEVSQNRYEERLQGELSKISEKSGTSL